MITGNKLPPRLRWVVRAVWFGLGLWLGLALIIVATLA